MSVTRKLDLLYLRHHFRRHKEAMTTTGTLQEPLYLEEFYTSPTSHVTSQMNCDVKDQSNRKLSHEVWRQFKAWGWDTRGVCGQANPLQEQGLWDAAERLITAVTDGRAQSTLVFWHTAGTAYHLVAPVSFSTQRLKSWEAEHILLPFFVSSTQFLWLSILQGLHPGQLAAQEK